VTYRGVFFLGQAQDDRRQDSAAKVGKDSNTTPRTKFGMPLSLTGHALSETVRALPESVDVNVSGWMCGELIELRTL
jgi:hypothetical protein